MKDVSPPQRPEHDPYKGTKVEPTEEKKEKEEFDRKELKKPENAFAAAIAESFKKFFRLIFGGEARRFKITPLTMMQYIEKILDAFERLKKEDCSQDLDFLNLFSQHWLAFVAASHRFDKASNKEVASFIQEISGYTQGLSHSLSYYLTEYADSEWIPFPFMEMLHNLFEENQKNPKDSQLEKWTNQIREIIRFLKSLEEH